MEEITLNQVCVFDCETTGIPAKGMKWDVDFADFPNIVQLAWSLGEKERSYIIKPNGWEIPEETVEIHGITTERAMREGVPFESIIDEFLADCKAAKLIAGHNIYFDTSIIKAMILRTKGREYYDANAEDALYKGKRIDTMMKTIWFVKAKYPDGRVGKYPRLEELYDKLFPGETFGAHDAMEDVRAVKRCLPELVKLGIIELKPKEYAENPQKPEAKPDSPKEPEPAKTKIVKRTKLTDAPDLGQNKPAEVKTPAEPKSKPEAVEKSENRANILLNEQDF